MNRSGREEWNADRARRQAADPNAIGRIEDDEHDIVCTLLALVKQLDRRRVLPFLTMTYDGCPNLLPVEVQQLTEHHES